MRALGWAVMGVDLSPHAAHVAQTAYGIDVRVGTLTQANFSGGHFAVVTMSHAIEHVPNPLTELQECFRILRPNGRLVLITPNAAGLMSRLFGRHWVSLDPPRHLSMFTVSTLRRFVESVGFRVERVRTRPRLSRFDYEKSLRIRRVGSAKDHIGSNAVGSAARACTLAEQALLAIWPWAGNELMLSAVKR
jgi:2-polyprenyl-3-methyl-5-hydroxy-6-metoxy-1,4-benzoquinol methylase